MTDSELLEDMAVNIGLFYTFLVRFPNFMN